MVKDATIHRSEAELRSSFEDARRERAFWDEHYAEFVGRYPDQFVAVKGGAVVAASTDLREFAARLQRLSLNPRELWLEYIRSTPPNWIL
jgi:hypothetical protein